MQNIKLNVRSEISLKNIKGFIEKTVTKFGTGAKVDCPKEYLGKKVYLIIIDE
jgi:putative transposon-encoded protein